MDERPALTAVNGTTPIIHTAGARWSPIPPKAVRKAAYQRLKKARRPVGTLAVPAIATAGSLYYTGVIPHTDGPMTLGLTALIVFYDSVIAISRSWHTSSTTATTDTSRAPVERAS
ncbi:hypothetical protein [Streptomyces massasporeus]|uniref:hypothetical protein n=1 Tax=Streptomyces massasporeus TaxID=67324 RepID=UPI00382F2CE0